MRAAEMVDPVGVIEVHQTVHDGDVETFLAWLERVRTQKIIARIQSLSARMRADTHTSGRSVFPIQRISSSGVLTKIDRCHQYSGSARQLH